jgi:C4-dicarboxylate transporter DctM subunit
MYTRVIIILLLLMGALAAYVPVYMSLFFTGILGFVFFAPETQTLMLVQSFFKSMDNFALVVVLFFILCGNIMTAGTIVEKLIKMVNTLVSWLPGGLGMAGCLGCGLFGAISGSTVATVVALGGFMIPALIKNGYSEKYSVGLMTTAPNLGIIIPPSISMILYSMITNVSLQGLFLTGFIPGIFIMAFTCFYTIFCSRTADDRALARASGRGDRIQGRVLSHAAGDHFRGHFPGCSRQRSRRGACMYAFFVELIIHKSIVRDEESHRRLGRDLGDAAHHRGRRHLFRPLPDLKRSGQDRRGGDRNTFTR